MPECLVAHIIQLASGQQPGNWQLDCFGNVPGYFLIVAGDDLQLHTSLSQVFDDLFHVRLRGIEEKQESGKSEIGFILDRIGTTSVISNFRGHSQHAETLAAPIAVASFDGVMAGFI